MWPLWLCLCRIIFLRKQIHDIVEIDTGDVYLYDEEKRKAVALKEAVAAERIFGLLPDRLRDEYLCLWKEYEAKETHEAKAAAVLDTLQPLINHDVTGTENRYGMTRTRVAAKKLFIRDVSPEMWSIAEHLIEKGWISVEVTVGSRRKIG